MFDETQIKIIDATMTIIVEKGYSGTTTKNIAKLAGVNECTIFRKFDGKKEIILAAMSLPRWNPGLSEKDFAYVGIPEEDLVSFSRTYMTKVTPQMVKISIGLRSAELEGIALPGIMKIPEVFKKVLKQYFTEMGIMKIPEVFKKVLKQYFTEMIEKGKLKNCDVESAALQFISMNFGFVFLNASFGDKLIGISKDEYIRNSVNVFLKGLE